jgi:hypothetical protein
MTKPWLGRQGADIQTKVEELEMASRGKLKYDAIAQLSVLTLSTRLEEIERQQV